MRRQREDVEAYDSTVIDTEAKKISKTGSGFTVEFQKGGVEPSQLTARFVILATGAEDIPPLIPNVEEAVQRGLVRYCPICDGYEAKGKKIGVIGVCDKGLGEAVFMARTYSPDVTLLSFHEPLVLSDQELGMAKEHGISVICEPIRTLSLDGRAVTARASKSGRKYRFDVIYSALGVRYRSGLAMALGAETDDMGALLIDCHSQTTVPGLYAAGDVTQGLNQIVVAMGQAAKAATRIHNSL